MFPLQCYTAPSRWKDQDELVLEDWNLIFWFERYFSYCKCKYTYSNILISQYIGFPFIKTKRIVISSQIVD